MRLTLRFGLAAICMFATCGALLAPVAMANRAFTPRFAQMARGDVTFAANTIMSCPSSAACTSGRAGTGGSINNQDFVMTYVDVDSDATTFDSSSANLTLPSGSTVLFAGLYWGADTTAGGSGAAAPSPLSRNTVKLKVPGGATYSNVTASVLDTDSASASRYQGFANVTSQVQAAGVGTYTVANVQAGTGTDRYGGWSLVVAYLDASEEVNWVSVYDGFESTGFGGSASSTDVVLNGFQTPASGTVAAKFGMVSYEGELGWTGETATLNGATLTDALHPAGNYFNSTISRLGSHVTAKNPNYVNQLGFDANVMNVDGLLPSGSTSATVHFSSSLDMFLPGVMTLVTDQVATAPVNTALPGVGGTVVDGQTLTAGDGTWSGSTPMTFAYQWRRCNSLGAGCADIAGATGSTYQLVSSDVGSTFRVVVTATNAVASASATSPASDAAAPAPPAGTSPPSVSGTARDGQTLTTTTGAWTGTPTISYAYQWQRCNALGGSCTDVSGATASTYALAPADVGSTMRAVVTATNAAGSATQTSSQTAVVAANPPVNTNPPAVSGTARDGQTLTATAGSWTGTPTISYAYQWQRCNALGASCADVGGATASTYALAPADVGSTMRAVVTATNAAGSAPQSSSQTAVVAANPPVNTGLPAVSGQPYDGQTLSGTPGSWTGSPTISYGYQWQRCDSAGSGCSDIAGATAATYDLTAGDLGSTVRLVVTATNAAGPVTTTSAPSAVITSAQPSVSGGGPSTSGTPQEGGTLTVDPGTWTGSAPITFEYQWRRCDAAGQNCVDIPGATGPSYQPTAADAGHTLVVVVTATNGAGSTTWQSPPSDVIAVAPPKSTGAPSITGDVLVGETLTAAPGTWTGAGPISYDYQWLRCDSAGKNCQQIQGATGSTYVVTSGDEGHTFRVDVTAANGGGSTAKRSDDTAPVPPKDGGGNGGGGDDEDLGTTVAGSEVHPSKCQRVLAGTGFKRQRMTGVGKISMQVAASAYISPKKPLKVTAKIPAKKVRSLQYLLDNRVVSRPKRAPYALSVSPKVFGKPGKHALAFRVTPKKGRSHRMTLQITTAPCDNVLSGFQFKTATGTGLRLRVDSRTAMGSATFTVPAKMLPSLKDVGKIGTLSVYLPGRRTPFELKLAKGDRTATLLRPNARRPRVVLTKKGVIVTGLPKRVGIVEITLYTRDKTKPDAFLPKRRKVKIAATVVERGKSVRLKSIITAQRH